MKYLITYLFLLFIQFSFSQIEVDVDSVVTGNTVHFCLEKNNVLYNWKNVPEKVLIRMFNRFGYLIIESNNVTMSTNDFLNTEVINDNSSELIIIGNQLVEGTYFFVVEFEKDNEKKCFKHFVILTRYCGCG